jgi:hypothetical protein
MSEQVSQRVTWMAQRRQISQAATTSGITATAALSPK